MDRLKLLEDMLLLRNFNPRDRKNLFLKMYPFSNENLGGYMSRIDLSGSTSLTTGSGTEQVFNLAYYGVKNIKVYDINPFVKYHFALKLAGLKELDDKEYMKYFHTGFRHKKLNRKYYERLRPLLDKESLEFWDKAYELYIDYNPLLLFKNDEITKSEVLYNNPYLKDKRKAIDLVEQANIDFQTRSILDLDNEKFDYIFLSNVLDYVDELNMRSSSFAIDEDLFNERISLYLEKVKELGNNLNYDGMLFYHYFWDVNNDFLPFFRRLLVTTAGNTDFKYMRFGDCRIPDGVAIYTKRKLK